MLSFQIIARDGAARRGLLVLPHAVVETPVFMPVGTAGTVKGISPDELATLDARIVLGNTYHLCLRPGHERVRRLGGLHRFMAWPRALLTDSGGFQVFSLGAGSRDAEGKGPGPRAPRGSLVRIAEEGVEFRSHLDGGKHFLGPEDSIAIQEALGADVIMAFDECPPALAGRAYHEASLARTQRWLLRCKAAWQEAERRKADAAEIGAGDGGGGEAVGGAGGGRADGAGGGGASASRGLAGAPSALFGIAQGGLFDDLRRRAIEEEAALDLPGYALGGYAVGEEPAQLWEGVARDAPRLPDGKPRYLMGVGTPEDLLAGISAGVDMFDCVLPTRCARNGLLFTSRGRLTIRNAAFQDDERPADPSCACPACRTFTRAYLRHLFRSGELLGLRLNTLHNLHYFLGLMAAARLAIEAGRLTAWAGEVREGWRAGPM